METLLSVGIDIGTTTTQLVFSRLTLRNDGSAFTVPDFSIDQKEVLYRSDIHFTPLISETEIDAEAIRAMVDAEYQKAGIQRSDISTGAVIITGETARRDNAAQVLEALSGYAGDFVVATAGPGLESVLAGKGAGAERYSREHHCPVLNLDIGGGTTNLALFDNGSLQATGCLNIGGRLMKLTPQGQITYISPVLRSHVALRQGQTVSVEQAEQVAELLARLLVSALEGKPLPADFITDHPMEIPGVPQLSFSGGVADLMDELPRPPFAYGDLGVLLGKALHRRFPHRLHPEETIRATVIGAGSHTTELSGSTIFYEQANFPLKNLPVVTLADEAAPPEVIARQIREKFSLFPDQTPVLALKGQRNPKFSTLCRLADGIAQGLEAAGQPMVIAVEHDMGKALGQAVGTLLPGTPLVCLDGIALHDGTYLDVGAPVANGQVLPVVVKTLVL